MTPKELHLELTKHSASSFVYVRDTNNNYIQCNFVFNQSIIHQNMLRTEAKISNTGPFNNTLLVRHVIERINIIINNKHNPSSIYKGQQLSDDDYVDNIDKQIYLSQFPNSIFCGNHKYLSPVDVINENNGVVIICKGLI